MPPRARGHRSAPAGKVSPGEHLRAEMRRLCLNQVTLSRALGVTRQTVNNVINDRLPISRALSTALGQLTHRPPDYWLQSAFAPAASEVPHALMAKSQIISAVGRGLIAIAPFVKDRVRAASIELTFGGGAAAAKSKPRLGMFRLRAGCSAFVVTQEIIQLSEHHVGRVGVTPEMAAAGLAAFAPLQVEPGFSGHLCIGVFNASAAEIALRPGEPVLALELIALTG